MKEGYPDFTAQDRFSGQTLGANHLITRRIDTSRNDFHFYECYYCRPMWVSSALQHPRFQRPLEQVYINSAFWISAAIAALVSVFYTKLFAFCEAWAFSQGGSFLIWAPTTGLLLSFLVGHFFSKEALGSGIPQVIAAVEISEVPAASPLLEKLLGFRMLLTKILGSCFCALGGGVSGREGPTLQVSASIFYMVHKIWPKALPKPRQSAMVLAGGSAGLAAAFNTPMGGIVFAIEELSKTHVSLVRTSIFQAVIISGFLAQYFLGNYVYLGSTQILVSSNIFFQTIVVSIIVGIVSAFFSNLFTELRTIVRSYLLAKKYC